MYHMYKTDNTVKVLATKEFLGHKYEIRHEPAYSSLTPYSVWGPDIEGRHSRMAVCSDTGRAHRKLEEITNPDRWVPANNGTETPFLSRSGRMLLYVWNPRQGKHAYLDVESDVILSQDEANAYMGAI